MHILKFESFNINPTDFVLNTENELFAFDIKFSSKEAFKEFDDFYQKHIDDEDSFDYIVNNESYHGRFGALIYDIEYNARVYILTAPAEMGRSFFTMSVTEFNTPNILINHEKRLNLLTSMLIEKGILNDDEASKFTSYLTTTDNGMDVRRQVKCLNDYLIEISSTLDNIRNDINNDF